MADLLRKEISREEKVIEYRILLDIQNRSIYFYNIDYTKLLKRLSNRISI